MNMEQKIHRWVRSWERKGYHDGLPDEAPRTLEENGRVPSWRMVCIAIMKNDKTLETLGFRRPPCEVYMELKRIELAERAARTGERVALRPIQLLLPGMR
jgi:predicted phosphoadenosine phosphosulfate sulfurtransferase